MKGVILTTSLAVLIAVSFLSGASAVSSNINGAGRGDRAIPAADGGDPS